MVFGSVSTLLFIAWHFETTSAPRKREKTFGYLFCPRTPYGFRVSLIGEEERKKERKKKENDDFRFFKIRFLGFYKAERKSEDIIGASQSEPHTTEFYAFLGILYIIIYYIFVRPLTKCACVKCFT